MLIQAKRPSLICLTALCLATTALSGCAGGPKPDSPAELSAVQPTKEQSILYGDLKDNLSTIKNMHGQNPKDALIAARYGKALRESGDIKSAKSILIPLAGNEKVSTLVNTELSAIYMSEANFSKAESTARKAVRADEKNYRAWRNLGAALDAQEKYKEGEDAFKKSLALWGGDDKVPVLNNLALNQAAQGYTDEALNLLYEAKKIDPNRVEIERNIRIIRTLNEPPEFKGVKIPVPENKTP